MKSIKSIESIKSIKSVESIESFVSEQFPSSYSKTIERRNKFSNFMCDIFSSDFDIKYNFVKVNGDGSCFFHAILRFFGYLTWMDLPNKDQNQFDIQEELLYVETLSNLRENSTEYIRNFTGQSDFILDQNVPEYQLICKYLSDYSEIRIIVIEYNSFKSDDSNKVYEFLPETGVFDDSVIMINLSNHFTLIFPTSSNSKYDTKTIRKLAADNIITKSLLSNKLG